MESILANMMFAVRCLSCLWFTSSVGHFPFDQKHALEPPLSSIAILAPLLGSARVALLLQSHPCEHNLTAEQLVLPWLRLEQDFVSGRGISVFPIRLYRHSTYNWFADQELSSWLVEENKAVTLLQLFFFWFSDIAALRLPKPPMFKRATDRKHLCNRQII